MGDVNIHVHTRTQRQMSVRSTVGNCARIIAHMRSFRLQITRQKQQRAIDEKRSRLREEPQLGAAFASLSSAVQCSATHTAMWAPLAAAARILDNQMLHDPASNYMARGSKARAVEQLVG